ncbi:hypothetical protein P7D95_05785 [Enterococcus avium]|uniref:hypothetical protein n=1 Tax=Enterococcus avium TaxID=33945 RepID=UPI00288D9F78|nr:hypothetical protein [Enterococcus avium]MDT2500306.1 hypothetical protein [Enterococcus avium]
MNKKVNLILASILFGGVATVLPLLLKICLFVGIGLLLFMKYDDWEYEQRENGGIEHD